jgi:hypothetical protein
VFGARVYEYFEVAVVSELLDQLNVALARGVNKGSFSHRSSSKPDFINLILISSLLPPITTKAKAATTTTLRPTQTTKTEYNTRNTLQRVIHLNYSLA